MILVAAVEVQIVVEEASDQGIRQQRSVEGFFHSGHHLVLLTTCDGSEEQSLERRIQIVTMPELLHHPFLKEMLDCFGGHLSVDAVVLDGGLHVAQPIEEILGFREFIVALETRFVASFALVLAVTYFHG